MVMEKKVENHLQFIIMLFYESKKYIKKDGYDDDNDEDEKLSCANFYIKDVKNNLDAIKNQNEYEMTPFSKLEKELSEDKEKKKEKKKDEESTTGSSRRKSRRNF